MESHEDAPTDKEVIDTMMDLASHMPPCPECGNICWGWSKYFLYWAMDTVLSPEGPMAMFLALVHRSGDTTEIKVSELENLRRSKVLVCQRTTDEKGNPIYRLSLVNKDMIDIQTLTRDKDDITEWPDLIHDD